MDERKLAGNLSFEVYTDGTINVEGKGLSLENASYSLGSIINDMVSNENAGSYDKMEQCHECIRAFADGLRADYIAAGWRETAKEVPFPEHNGVEFPDKKEVLFTTPGRRVLAGIYYKKEKVFRNIEGTEKYHPDDVPYWMPMPVAPLGREWHDKLDMDLENWKKEQGEKKGESVE